MKNILKYLLSILLKPLFYISYKAELPHFAEDFDCRYVYMINELPGGEEKWQGTKHRKAHLGNTHPWNRYFNKPLKTQTKTLKDIEIFLRKCRYMSDRQTRSQDEFWEPPDLFEKRRRGDCEDHSIWAWRQLHEMGYRSRLVLGKMSNSRYGHAWVHIFINGRCYLLEATQKYGWLPTLSRYIPLWSIEHIEKKKFRFFDHFGEKIETSNP